MIVRLLVLLALAGVTARPADAGTSCHEVAGSVSFNGLRVVPEHPAVGDDVQLQFDVSAAVYSVTSLHLDGTSPFLEGETSLFGARVPSFQLMAVQAGTAMVQLSITYGTEEACTDYYGNTYFREGPSHTVTSETYAVEIAEQAPSCPGDCDGDGHVSIDELVRAVAIALGGESLDQCIELDRDHDATVDIEELVGAVGAALSDCGAPPPP